MSPTVRAFHYVKRVGFGINNEAVFTFAIDEAFWARFTRRQRFVLRVKLCGVALRCVPGAEFRRLRRFVLQCMLYAITRFESKLKKIIEARALAAHSDKVPNVPIVAQSAWSEAPREICRSRIGC